MHVSGNTRGLVAGCALAVQASGSPQWSLCVVRWARSDNPEHLELGLEVIGASAQAVRLIRPGGSESDESGQAFLLPPISAAQRGEALLCVPGFHQARGLTLVSESAGRIQVTECMPGPLLLQTSRIELFEFSRDFSPGA
jgi:hypothetical protein